MSRDFWESLLYLKMKRTITPFNVPNFDSVPIRLLKLSRINCFSFDPGLKLLESHGCSRNHKFYFPSVHNPIFKCPTFSPMGREQ